MKIEIFIVTVKNDNGTTKLNVVSLSGKQGAIQQITASEHCPVCAIVEIVKIDNAKMGIYESQNDRRSQRYG